MGKMKNEKSTIGIKPGKVVTWDSQSAGVQAHKKGIVIGTVPAGIIPNKDKICKMFGAAPQFDAGQLSIGRRSESFLVLVKRGENKKPYLYWPITSKLQVRRSRPFDVSNLVVNTNPN